jgi:hypothetical protein
VKRAALAVLVASVGLVLPGWVSARARADGPPLAGYNVSAVGVGAQFVYNQPSAPIPATPTSELEAAYSLSTFNAGPSAHSLASMLWPGSTAAGAGPALGLLLPVNPGIPAYPVRAETFFPQPPNNNVNEVAPGSRMEASSTATLSRAASALAGANQPALVSGGAYTSEAASGVVGRAATATATAKASGVKLAGGVVSFDSVASTATVVSDGQAAKTDGQSVVTGLVIAGQAAVIDASGVHAGPGGPGTAAATQLIQSTLKQVGISLQLAEPTDLVDGPKGDRTLGGLLVTFDAAALAKHFDTLPASVGATLKKQLPFDQSLVLAFGAVHVGSAATVASAVSGAATAPGDATGGGGTTGASTFSPGTPATPGTPGVPAGLGAVPTGRPATAAPLAASPAAAVGEEFGGVTGMLVLALLAAVALAPWLAAVPVRLFASPVSTAACGSKDG